MVVVSKFQYNPLRNKKKIRPNLKFSDGNGNGVAMSTTIAKPLYTLSKPKQTIFSKTK